jgi:hypothetical protein
MSNRTCKSLSLMGQVNESVLLILGDIVTKKILTPMVIL